MTWFDYSLEPKSDVAFIDMKSFYASVECVDRGLHPLKTSLCVMSRADNSAGLILASSPMFKKVFGKSNVGRSYDLPFDVKTRKFSYYNAKKQGLPTTIDYVRFIEEWAKSTVIVPPRMDTYIAVNMEIQKIFQDFAAPDDIYPYSIDEGFIDLTSSLNYFVPDKSISRKDKLDIISAAIQKKIWRKTGIYSTVGMSNANPLLAKLALDNEAKKTPTMRANWSYEDIEKKVWAIPKMTDFWGIGNRMEKRLHNLSIFSIKELAQANPDLIKKELGIMGLELWFHANGVDESKPSVPYKPKSKGLGNSQVLPKDYTIKSQIELVLSEMAEQVAIRLRRTRKKAKSVHITISYSRIEEKRPLVVSQKIKPTQNTKQLTDYVLSLFRKKYTGGAVRSIAVRYDNLVDDNITIISLFDDIKAIEKQEKIDKTLDSIRDKYGFLAVQNGSILMEGSRVKERSKLVGGHAGGMDGIS